MSKSLSIKDLPLNVAPECCKKQHATIEGIYGPDTTRSREFDCPGCLRRWQFQSDGSWAIVNT